MDGKPALTEGAWAGALYAATQLEFNRYRQHIINTMKDQVRGMGVFEVLDLASRCQVAEWRFWALQELCERPESLTADEGRKLGFEMLVAICSIREKFARSSPNRCEYSSRGSYNKSMLGCTCYTSTRVLSMIKAEKALNLDF